MEIHNHNLINKINVSHFIRLQSPVDVNWIRIINTSSLNLQRFEEHMHNFFEIHFLIEGTSKYECKNEVLEITKNQYIILPPNVTHKLVSNSEPFLRLAMDFRLDKRSELYENFILKNQLKYDITPDMNEIIQFIFGQIENPKSLYDIIISRSAQILAYLVIEDVSKRFSWSIKTDCPDVRLLQAKKYILDNPNKFLTCSEVASYCYISPKQLGRLFQKYEGKSMFEFIREKKLADVLKLITETNLSQKAISDKLGFSSSQYYNTFCKNNIGMSPEEYRLKNSDIFLMK